MLSNPSDLIRSALSERLGEPRFQMWFSSSRFELNEGELVLKIPNSTYQDYISKKFLSDIQVIVGDILGPVPIRFQIDPSLPIATEEKTAEPKTHRASKLPVGSDSGMKSRGEPRTYEGEPRTPEGKLRPISADEEPKKSIPKAPPLQKRRWKSLEQFVTGSCNRVAWASALSVVEEPGLGANPLVIYGPTGTGKTHLLEGIYLGIRRSQPDAKVLYLTAEDFMNRFLGAVYQNKQYSFRKQFRECFALIVDDLTFLAGKKATQVEFLHTFDALVGEGCQVVVSCDSHPRLCDDLMPELVDRLLGGAVWGVLPPDPETRLALLRAKSTTGTPTIPDEILRFLATHLRGNVRELEGAIHSIRHVARVTGKAIDQQLAREALAELLRHAVRVVRIHDVDVAVCQALKLPAGALKSKSKTWAVSHARMLAVYLARKHTSATYGEISMYLGNKTHSTAVAAEKKVRAWLEKDESVKAGDHVWKAKDLVERVERELFR
ncbi:MAG: DnaA/Hda family protein [Gemmataceae bacterium]|nr:DnaA/Hda family protein [Gemmataceae bacterium]